MRWEATIGAAILVACVTVVGSCSSSSNVGSGSPMDGGMDATGGASGATDAEDARAGAGGGGAGGTAGGSAEAGAGGDTLAERICGRYGECGLTPLTPGDCIALIASFYEVGDGGVNSELCASNIRAFDDCRTALTCDELRQLEDYGDRCADAGGFAGYPFCTAEAEAFAAACSNYSPDCH